MCVVIIYFQVVFVLFFFFLQNCIIVVSNLAKLHFRALPVGIYNLLTHTAFLACFRNPLGYFFVGFTSDALILNSNGIDMLQKITYNVKCNLKCNVSDFKCHFLSYRFSIS